MIGFAKFPLLKYYKITSFNPKEIGLHISCISFNSLHYKPIFSLGNKFTIVDFMERTHM